MRVPFLDLKVQYESIRNEIDLALQQVLENTAFASGPYVKKFEQEFATFCNCQYGIGVGSGTSALWLTLLGLGIGGGDEVITVPNTFIATAEAISFCGARPIFIDVDETTYNMDPDLIEAAITPRTKAIIPVHLFGQMAEIDPIMDIAKGHRLYVIEDACQAHGAKYKGRSAGSIGNAGCFSFYPGKNLGAYGEGGIVVTNDSELDHKIRILCDHGQAKKYYHSIIGWNSRMDGFQGAILSMKLKHLTTWNNKRRQNARLYSELLSEITDIILPYEADYAKHVYHVYALRTENRDALIEYLAEKDIYCGIHYPIPIHLQDAYSFLGIKKGSFPIAEKCAEEFVSLPMFPELSGEQIEYVVHAIEESLVKEAVTHAKVA